MKRVPSSTVLAVAASAVAVAPLVRAGDIRSRRFEIRYEATTEAPEGTTVDLWLPLPHKDDAQAVLEIRAEATAKGAAVTPEVTHAGANELLHVRGPAPVVASFVAKVERRERRVDPEALAKATATLPLSAEEQRKHAAELAAERLNPVDDGLRERAAKIAPGETRLARVARAIYDHVLGTMRYDKPASSGWGQGSVGWACKEGFGNCTDFHALFIALCRVKGIPARFSIGLSLPSKEREGEVKGYHCWAEFLCPGVGWVPVDASEAWKDKTRREYFYGSFDEHRLELTTGRDLVLSPPQKGDPLNYMVDPYAEADGKRIPAKRKAAFKDVE